jgi:hypothetical protein
MAGITPPPGRRGIPVTAAELAMETAGDADRV